MASQAWTQGRTALPAAPPAMPSPLGSHPPPVPTPCSSFGVGSMCLGLSGAVVEPFCCGCYF